MNIYIYIYLYIHISGPSGFVVNTSTYYGPFGVLGQYIKVFWFFKSCRSRRELSNALVKSFWEAVFVEIWPF